MIHIGYTKRILQFPERNDGRSAGQREKDLRASRTEMIKKLVANCLEAESKKESKAQY